MDRIEYCRMRDKNPAGAPNTDRVPAKRAWKDFETARLAYFRYHSFIPFTFMGTFQITLSPASVM